ncbi:hypothetical protein A4D02_35430 [Niastella koreensis]|nr:hypothetical protein A4D02_35430 [Niastella koreensis]
MTEDEISEFEKIQVQLESLHEEISALAKKSNNDALNKFKLKFVNSSISIANKILGDDYKPFHDFEAFNEDDVPTNSDVTMILGQYLSCLEKLRADNISAGIGGWYWKGEEGLTKIRTAPPKKIQLK